MDTQRPKNDQTNDSEISNALDPKDSQEATSPVTSDDAEDEFDFGGVPKDAPDMKRFLGCGG